MSRFVAYYEAFGDTLTTLFKMLKERAKVKKEMHDWAGQYGSNKEIGVNDGGFGFSWTLVCRDGVPKGPENWKRAKNSNEFWVPRISTKEGKRLKAEMDALTERLPSTNKMMTFLEVPLIDGLYINSIGIHPVKKRIFLEIPGEYTPPKNVKLRRISDLQFEKLCRPKRKKSNAKNRRTSGVRKRQTNRTSKAV